MPGVHEELSNLNIAVTATNQVGESEVGRIAYLSRQFELAQGLEQAVGTTPELLLIVPSVPTYIYIRNLGLTMILVDSVSTMNAFPQRIIVGGSIVLSPQTGTIYIKSIVSDGKVWVMSVY
jgi:hypothetical protein